jgi:hypothetical protein
MPGFGFSFKPNPPSRYKVRRMPRVKKLSRSCSAPVNGHSTSFRIGEMTDEKSASKQGARTRLRGTSVNVVSMQTERATDKVKPGLQERSPASSIDVIPARTASKAAPGKRSSQEVASAVLGLIQALSNACAEAATIEENLSAYTQRVPIANTRKHAGELKQRLRNALEILGSEDVTAREQLNCARAAGRVLYDSLRRAASAEDAEFQCEVREVLKRLNKLRADVAALFDALGEAMSSESHATFSVTRPRLSQVAAPAVPATSVSTVNAGDDAGRMRNAASADASSTALPGSEKRLEASFIARAHGGTSDHRLLLARLQQPDWMVGIGAQHGKLALPEAAQEHFDKLMDLCVRMDQETFRLERKFVDTKKSELQALLARIEAPAAELRHALMLWIDDRNTALAHMRHARSIMQDGAGECVSEHEAAMAEKGKPFSEADPILLPDFSFKLYHMSIVRRLGHALSDWHQDLERIIRGLELLPVGTPRVNSDELEAQPSSASVNRVGARIRRVITGRNAIAEDAVRAARQLEQNLPALKDAVDALQAATVSASFHACLDWMSAAIQPGIAIDEMERAIHRARHYFLPVCEALRKADARPKTEAKRPLVSAQMLELIEKSFHLALETVMHGTSEGAAGQRSPLSPRASLKRRGQEDGARSKSPRSPRSRPSFTEKPERSEGVSPDPDSES